MKKLQYSTKFNLFDSTTSSHLFTKNKNRRPILSRKSSHPLLVTKPNFNFEKRRRSFIDTKSGTKEKFFMRTKKSGFSPSTFVPYKSSDTRVPKLDNLEIRSASLTLNDWKKFRSEKKKSYNKINSSKNLKRIDFEINRNKHKKGKSVNPHIRKFSIGENFLKEKKEKKSGKKKYPKIQVKNNKNRKKYKRETSLDILSHRRARDDEKETRQLLDFINDKKKLNQEKNKKKLSFILEKDSRLNILNTKSSFMVKTRRSKPKSTRGGQSTAIAKSLKLQALKVENLQKKIDEKNSLKLLKEYLSKDQFRDFELNYFGKIKDIETKFFEKLSNTKIEKNIRKFSIKPRMTRLFLKQKSSAALRIIHEGHEADKKKLRKYKDEVIEKLKQTYPLFETLGNRVFMARMIKKGHFIRYGSILKKATMSRDGSNLYWHFDLDYLINVINHEMIPRSLSKKVKPTFKLAGRKMDKIGKKYFKFFKVKTLSR